MSEPKFWETKTLAEMDKQEWEALCDGCGKCCVVKLQDEDTEEIYSTDVGCKLLDCQTARCRDYENRKSFVPDCVILTPDNLDSLSWMPKRQAAAELASADHRRSDKPETSRAKRSGPYFARDCHCRSRFAKPYCGLGSRIF